ncbi:MAG: hypothetical protein AVDCRST_MAG19-4610, partial [uncultured Thermomicrobiales bacterium]
GDPQARGRRDRARGGVGRGLVPDQRRRLPGRAGREPDRERGLGVGRRGGGRGLAGRHVRPRRGRRRPSAGRGDGGVLRHGRRPPAGAVRLVPGRDARLVARGRGPRVGPRCRRREHPAPRGRRPRRRADGPGRRRRGDGLAAALAGRRGRGPGAGLGAAAGLGGRGGDRRRRRRTVPPCGAAPSTPV